MKNFEFDDGQYHVDTLAIRAGTTRSEFGEHSEALFLTSSYVFENSENAAARFANHELGNVYSRFTNPTVAMFEKRLAALEGAEAAVATASGMAAIMACCMGTLKQGDHIVCSQSVFGSTMQLFNNVLTRFGITTSYVNLSDTSAWQKAIQPNTKMFYVETPSNPLMELADLQELSLVAKSANALLVVDNCFCTPILQQPLKFGADLVIHSATKYIDGQGRVLGGAIVGEHQFLKDNILPVLRICGPTLSPFNAWVLLKGLETLSLRMHKQSENALQLAQWLEKQPQVKKVFYPGLPSHPQYELASKQQKMGGAVLAFELYGNKDAAWRVIDQCQLLSITANLGDTKTTIIHPGTTTHGRISEEARQAAGITQSMIRIAVGLEHVDDICNDLKRGLLLI